MLRNTWLSAVLAGGLACGLTCGFGASGVQGGEGKDKPKDAHAHDHVHVAPHGGVLVELGDHYANAELVFDAASGKLTVYLLDAHAENPSRSKQKKLTLKLEQLDGGKIELEADLAAVANPLTGETVGDTSQFEAVIERLKGAKSFSGEIEKIEARGKNFKNVEVGFPKAPAHKH